MTTQDRKFVPCTPISLKSAFFSNNSIVFIFNCLFCCTVSDRKFAGFIEVEVSSEIEMLMSIQEFC